MAMRRERDEEGNGRKKEEESGIRGFEEEED